MDITIKKLNQIVISLILCMAPVLCIANALKLLEYSTLGTNFEINFKFQKKRFEPIISTTTHPARIIIDFEGVKNKLSQNTYSVEIDNLKSIQVLSDETKLRVILNLRTLDYFQIAQKKKQLFVFSGPSARPGNRGYQNKNQDFVFFNHDSNPINLMLVTKKLQQKNEELIKSDELEILWRQSGLEMGDIFSGLPRPDPLNFKDYTIGNKDMPSFRSPISGIGEQDGQSGDVNSLDGGQQKKSEVTAKIKDQFKNNNTSKRKTTIIDPQKPTIVLEDSTILAPQIQKLKIVDFEFERVAETDAILRLNFSNSNIDVDIQKHYREIIFKFFHTQIAEEKIALLDVRNFRTVVDKIDFTNYEDYATVGIEVNDNFEYLIYQAENKYSIIVSSKIDPDKLSNAILPSDEQKIDFNFDNIKVGDAIKVITSLVNVDVVLPQNIEGIVSVRLHQIPWDQAVRLILRSTDLDSMVQDNVLIVQSRQFIENLQKQIAQKQLLERQIVRIENAEASYVAKFLKTANIVSARGNITVDSRTNALLLEDDIHHIIRLKSLIAQVDVPIQQVAIEAYIVVANTSFRNEIGVRWGVADSTGDIKLFANRENALDIKSDNLAVNLAANSFATVNLGVLDIGRILDIELSAMESKGKGEVVSKPKIITGNNQKASISSGQEFAFYNRDREGLVSTTSFKQAVLSLQVTPQITHNEEIILDLNIDQDSLTGFSDGVPIIDVTKLRTKVKVQNGKTIVLGGVYQNNESSSIERVPFLGYLPILGRLFQRRLKTNLKQEILIFITPRILTSQ